MKCRRCNLRDKKKHANAKWCEVCALELRKRPLAILTNMQIRKVKNLAGTMYAHEVAESAGISVSCLKRWARDNNVSLNYHHYDRETVEKVCSFYVVHGRIKTEKKFPEVRVRSIVERYLKPLGMGSRQTRWTEKQLIELVRMGGLVKPSRQADFFKRPGARGGSIVSAWQKKFGHSSVNINGLSHNIAKHYVTKACPFYQTSFYENKGGARWVALWVDVETYLTPTTPTHLVDAIRALAKFQNWLHGQKVHYNIGRILEERA